MTQEDASDKVTWIDSPDAGNKDIFDSVDDSEKPSSQLRYSCGALLIYRLRLVLSLFTLKGAKKKTKKPIRPPPKKKITDNATQLKMLLESSQRTATPDVAETVIQAETIVKFNMEPIALGTCVVQSFEKPVIPSFEKPVQISDDRIDGKTKTVSIFSFKIVIDFPEMTEEDLCRIDLEVASQLNVRSNCNFHLYY